MLISIGVLIKAFQLVISGLAFMNTKKSKRWNLWLIGLRFLKELFQGSSLCEDRLDRWPKTFQLAQSWANSIKEMASQFT